MLRYAEFHSVLRRAPAAAEDTMHMTMLKDRVAAIDDAGTVIADLHAGSTYELPAALAATYLERGYAKPATDGAELTVPGRVAVNEGTTENAEQKDEGGSPEDKNAGAAPETKRAPRTRKPRTRKNAGDA